MKAAVARFFGNWWVLSVLVAVVVAIVLTLIVVLVVRPHDLLIWLLALIALVILVWAACAAYHVFSARRASDHIADALARDAAQNAGEAATVNRRMAEAMARLKQERGNRRDYLYSRPWYVIVGPPGAGKTTAIKNSGLRLPFVDRDMVNVSGTRDLEFLFADEAVIVDTAGRYFSQDSAQDRDREGWLKFLDLLRRNRPLQPINGVIVAIGIDILLTANARELDQHTDMIRRRLAELKLGLEVNAPVYVVFTKSDRMAGFAEFFDDLDVDQRRAVLGATLPADTHGANPDKIAQAFDEVVEALADRAPKRLQDELDQRRRGLILGFPAQLAGLRTAVTRLLEGAFPGTAREGPGLLRGFYFTSGVQEGGTLDRLLGAAASVFETPTPIGGSGRAYFINRLLTEVMFGETGLVQGTAGVRRRRGALLTAGLATIGAIAATVLLVWTVVLFADLSWQKTIEAKAADAVAKMQAALSPDGKTPLAEDLTVVTPSANPNDPQTLSQAALALDALRALPDGYDAKGAPFQAWTGIYDYDLAKDETQAYLQALRRVLYPRMLVRLETVQQGLLGKAPSDPTGGDLYAPLKVYMLLGQAQPINHPWTADDRTDITNWFAQDWQANVFPGVADKATVDSLNKHLAALLPEASNRDDDWPGHKAPVETNLITQSQTRLANIPVEQRIYAILKGSIAPKGDQHDWRLEGDALTQEQLMAFGNAAQLAQLPPVPFLYTQAGSVAFFAGAKSTGDMLAKDWVVGSALPQTAIGPGVLQAEFLYANDYVNRWTTVINAPVAADYAGNADARREFLGPTNPLKTFVTAVVKQTKLSGTLDPQDPGGFITQNFNDLSQWLDQQGPDNVVKALNGATSTAAAVAQSNSASAATQTIGASSDMTQATQSAPKMIAPFVNAVAQNVRTAGTHASIDSLRNYYAANLALCAAATRGFPFDENAPSNADLPKVLQMFSQGGPLDQVTGGLLQYVDNPGKSSKWHWNADGTAASLDPDSADSLRQAQQIETLLRPGGVDLAVNSVQFGPGVTSATLAIGAAKHDLSPTQPQPALYNWIQSAPVYTASLTVAGQPPYSEQGPFALFRLFHDTRTPPTVVSQTPQSTVVRAQFGSGASLVAFTVTLPGGVSNPFVGAPAGPWAFRCPAKL